ncbi:metalloproteinase inhibitor 2-like isoform X1 [Nerophis ophidion]|uniref:metalloproteinase inhibitor 2-like isoform X1 n=1 Tax=Nerophis ophidion TaxID=159077 RepID=UPI002AE086FE|nr:metalloproteinase inhibitor 2-like isoform X1 [Nerophis ophidion]
MMSWMKCCVFPLVLLCMWQLQEGAQACTCPYDHPQTQFCQSDVAIKAKVVSEAAGEFEYDVTYEIKLTKILKGPIRHYDTICTASSSAACGVTLEKGVEYFVTGQLKSDGSLRVSSCNYVVPWKSSHDTLVEHFMMGCDCKITRCSSVPCGIGSPTECLWTNTFEGQDKQSACIKKSDGSCCWYSEEPNKH